MLSEIDGLEVIGLEWNEDETMTLHVGTARGTILLRMSMGEWWRCFLLQSAILARIGGIEGYEMRDGAEYFRSEPLEADALPEANPWRKGK